MPRLVIKVKSLSKCLSCVDYKKQSCYQKGCSNKTSAIGIPNNITVTYVQPLTALI